MMLGVLLSGLLIAAVTNGQGPSTNATCKASFEWSYNSLGQTPCQVAAFLGAPCNDGIFFVPALVNATGFYTGPPGDSPCGCSTVFYSVLSACAECQSGQVLLWENFSKDCTRVYASVYPGDIPDGTRVPHWAYQIIPPGGGFNATLAQLQLNALESTASPEPSSTSTPPSNPSRTASSKKSDAGPIAGGVVGGIVVLLLICIAVFWFLRRRRRGDAPSNAVPLPMGYHNTGDITPFTSAIPTPKLYDPADPSTFPSTPSSGMYAGGRVHSPSASGNTMAELSMHRPQYSGAPEV
ncbi:hypothetical protein C8F01DRAFT_79222 [Mycena amicta]|nr:hypothetical protein C8F01DRAFT_79222 [Mycena amicta]